MIHRRLSSVSLLVLVCVATFAQATPAEDRRTLGGMSFALPAQWKFEDPAGQDHTRLVYADSKRYCIVVMYQPIGSDNIEIDFVREWKAIAGTIKDEQPKATRRKVGGRAVIEATGTITASEGSVLFERVGVLGGDGQMMAMIVMTATEATHRACAADADAIYASVKFIVAGSPSVPAPGTAPAPTTAQPQPAAGLVGTLKTAISLADVAGKWTFGSSAVTYYVNSSGDRGGAVPSFVNMGYTFRADGTYEYRESGMSNGSRFTDVDTGTLALNGTNLVLTAKGGRVQTFQVVAFMNLPDSSAVMTLYEESQTGGPLDAAAIAKQCSIRDGMFQCTNGQMWSRAAPAAKPKAK